MFQFTQSYLTMKICNNWLYPNVLLTRQIGSPEKDAWDSNRLQKHDGIFLKGRINKVKPGNVITRKEKFQVYGKLL